jgi:hypothetical protein
VGLSCGDLVLVYESAAARILVPEHQELGIFGHLTPGQHHQAAEQTANEQVDDREDHSAMIPARKTGHARSDNRAQHDPGHSPDRPSVTERATSRPARSRAASCGNDTPIII